MTRARFCMLSLLLVLTAVGVHGLALKDWSRNVLIRARAVSVAQDQKPAMQANADRFTYRGSVLYVVGICLAVAGAVALRVSFLRHEQVPWRLVPVALLVFYLVFQFVAV